MQVWKPQWNPDKTSQVSRVNIVHGTHMTTKQVTEVFEHAFSADEFYRFYMRPQNKQSNKKLELIMMWMENENIVKNIVADYLCKSITVNNWAISVFSII